MTLRQSKNLVKSYNLSASFVFSLFSCSHCLKKTKTKNKAEETEHFQEPIKVKKQNKSDKKHYKEQKIISPSADIAEC